MLVGHAPGGGSAQALPNCRISCLPACLACLLAGVHVPVAWSDVRPTDEEFREAFASVRLRCHRVVDFVRARRAVLRRLVLTNSEGYWAGGCSAAAAARGMAPEGVLLALLRKPVYMQCRRVCSCCFCLPDMLSAALTCHCLPACLPACLPPLACRGWGVCASGLQAQLQPGHAGHAAGHVAGGAHRAADHPLQRSLCQRLPAEHHRDAEVSRRGEGAGRLGGTPAATGAVVLLREPSHRCSLLAMAAVLLPARPPTRPVLPCTSWFPPAGACSPWCWRMCSAGCTASLWLSWGTSRS